MKHETQFCFHRISFIEFNKCILIQNEKGYTNIKKRKEKYRFLLHKKKYYI